jgi:transcriptional regulator with XRE-family HTH domain
MPIHTIIRNKRKELNLTQEQIADYLGVSTPAVNKWEKGVTYPDISLLPPLARVLKIDLNTLLCFEEGLTTNEITQFCKEIMTHIESEGYESGFRLAKDKILKYPNCMEFLDHVALVLEGALLFYGANLENREYYEEQIFSLYERAANGENETIRNKALYMLVSKYITKEDYEKAQQMLDLLPERLELDKKLLQAQLFYKQNKLEEASRLLEQKLLKGINEVQLTIFSLIDVSLADENDEKAIRLANGLAEIVRQFDLWDYNAYVAPLHIAVKRKNASETISILSNILEKVMTPWNLNDSSLYTHLRLQEQSNHADNNNEITPWSKKILPSLLSKMEKEADYEFLQGNKEFMQLMNKYKKKCNYETLE